MYEYPDSVRETAYDMMRSGTSAIELASSLGISRGTVYVWLKELQSQGEDVSFVKRPSGLKELSVARLLAGASAETICKELGVSRAQLERWRNAPEQPEQAEASCKGLVEEDRRHSARLAKGRVSSESAKDIAIRQLQTSLAEKQMLIDFFEGALQKVEARRRQGTGPGETESTRKSER